MERDSRTCRVCGRRFAWRARSAAEWDTMTTCSKACRKAGVRALDRELEATIEALLDRCSRKATICPSEAARAVRPDDWRPLMERTRRAARRLAARGRVEITQRGQVVDPSDARGPIRLRRRDSNPGVDEVEGMR